ncbi:MAG: nucleotidyltransferase domain-containing protein [Rubrobacteraceae bacterium]
MMLPHDVLEIVDRLGTAGVRVWLDGGWGVDALIGRQTRDHDDLDIVIPLPEADAAQRTLTVLGFEIIEDEATLCFVARDSHDRRVDVHTVVLDEQGGGLQRLENGTSWRYPPEGFSGTGRVEDRTMACLSTEVQILCHLNYEPDETDHRNMRLLAESCGMPLPAPYGA